MPEFMINDFSVVPDAHLIETQSAVFLEHGGVVTRMGFDHVEVMDVATFRDRVAPTLAPDPDHLIMVKDSASGSATFILGDRVLKYKLTSMDECSLQDVISKLELNGGKDNKYNTPFPIIREKSVSGFTVTTAAFPAERRAYKYWNKIYDIWIPPTWFALRQDVAGRVGEYRMCVVPQWSPVFEATEMYKWPLGNVYETGKICTGTSEIEATIDKRTMTLADVIIQHRERVMNMNHNDDLMNHFSRTWLDSVNSLYAELRKDGTIPEADNEVCGKILSIMSMREGMERMPMASLRSSPEVFTS